MFLENSCDVTLKNIALGGLHCGNKKVVKFFTGTMDIEFSKSTTLTEISDYIKAGKLSFLPDYDDIKDADKETQKASNTFQEDRTVGGGIKGWDIMWDQGICFQSKLSELYDLKGNGVGLIMEDGSVILRRKKNGAYGLFQCTFLEGLYKVRTGADMAGSSLQVQLKYIATQSWQREAVSLNHPEIDFRDISATTGLKIEFFGVVAGSASNIQVKIKQSCHNSDVKITGADKFIAYINGIAVNVVSYSYDSLNKIYNFIFDDAYSPGDTLQIVTMDASGNSTIQIAEAYYYGESEIVTVD